MSNTTNGNETRVAVRQAASVALADRYNMTPEKLDLLKRTIARGASDDELELFLYRAGKLGLDPFIGQVWGIKRRSKNKQTNQWETVFQTQTGIDGYRLMVQRTKELLAVYGPFWCGTDGQWRDVWLEDKPPAAARFGVLRKGMTEPTWAVARWKTYVQTTDDGSPTKFWADLPDLMLGNAAERLACRRAFPHETVGIETEEVTPEQAAEQLAATETEYRRDTALLQTPHAASPRFHTKPRDLVLPSGRVFISGEEMAEADDPEPAEPVEDAKIDTALGPPMPEEIAQLLAGAVRQAITGEPLTMTPVAAATALRGASNRLKLFESYGQAERRAALLAVLHFAQTGEVAPEATVSGQIDRRWLVWLQEAPNATIEALGLAADWWLARGLAV